MLGLWVGVKVMAWFSFMIRVMASVMDWVRVMVSVRNT